MTNNTETLDTPTKKEITIMVAQLFDQDIENLPENFKNIDPVAFSKEVIKQKSKRGYRETIKIPCNYIADKSESVLKKINAARLQINGKTFDELWACFDTSLDISVMGSDVWAPHILPNGGLLIRNHHRVIGIEETLVGTINISNQQLQEELLLLQEIVEDDDLGINFHFVHRDEKGFLWTKFVPEKLSNTGQTIIFIGNEIIEKARSDDRFSEDHFIFNDDLMVAASNSRSGHAVIRVFENNSFLYSTYRASDEYDTILEEYSYYLGSSPDEDTFDEKVSAEFEFTNRFVQNRLSDVEENGNIDIFETTLLKTNKFLKLLVKDKISNGYVNAKSIQISGFAPLFGTSWDIPSTYYKDDIPFFDYSKNYQGRIIAIKGNYASLPNISKSIAEFKDIIKKSVAQVPDSIVKIYLPTSKKTSRYIDENDIFDYSSNEFNTQLKLVFKEIKADFIKSRDPSQKFDSIEDEEKDYLDSYGYDFEFAILFITRDNPDLSNIHSYGLNVSQHLSGSIDLMVPSYGFFQGYCDGELDTGNFNLFIIPHDEDEDYDEDDEESE